MTNYAESIYPQLVPEEDVIKMINEKSYKEGNKYRIKAIKDFIDELNNDYVKYNDKKNRYCLVKNILMSVDISLGGILTIASVILEAITFGASTALSVVMGATGIGIVSTLPISNKISDKLASKNRNFEIYAKNHLNEVKLIFSKALNDDYINHEEYELVIKSKEEYLAAKQKLKTQNKKEIDKIFNDKKNIKLTNFSTLSDKDIKQLNKQAKNELKENQKKEYLKDLLKNSTT